MKGQQLLKDQIDLYTPLIEAVVNLFHPFAEAAVHDLRTGRIVKIYHNLSQRKEGESSPLHELGIPVDQFPDHFTPYYKQNWDGRPLKCTSITIRDSEGRPIGLICINVDVSFFQDAQKLFQTFLNVHQEAANPIELFGGGEEQILKMMEEYLNEHQLTVNHLTKNQKKEVIQHLYVKGAFYLKNAAPLLAKTLKISRASVYNYIKEIGGA